MTLQERPRLVPEEVLPDTFHALVRRCRDQHGLSQQAFAALLGDDLAQSTVAHWESGTSRLPRHDLLLRLADVCATPPGRLLDLLGFWGSGVTSDAPIANADSALGELLEAAKPLSSQQRRMLIALAREMRRA